MTGRLERQGNGNVAAQFRLWDVIAGQQLHGQQTSTSPDNYRRLAHIISDQIYQRLTGEMGYFDTRVVFIDEVRRRANQRTKRLAIMDQDGANVRYLTRGDDLVLTPRFSPSTQEITYMSYGQGQPRVYLLNIETGQREVVGNFPGMTFAPRFSHDGHRVIMSLQQGGNSNIFVMDLRSRTTMKLTDTAAIDTAPSYSPDGARICFEFGSRRPPADLRDGRQRRARATASASARARIRRRCGRRAATTSPSPSRRRAGSRSASCKPDGSGERILTDGYHNEGPTWAPNGRVLMFFRDPGGNSGPQLFTVDVTGRNEQRIPTPAFGSDPAWSPLLR